jgi:two-component system KDP operon response regulator KdpE
MRRVLVLGSEPRDRSLLGLSLVRGYYDVRVAAPGREGLRSIRSVRPDILLLELKYPDSEGSELLADIRVWSSIPVVVLSAHGPANHVAALLDVGADDYLTIPFYAEELLARMNAVLRRTLPSIKDSSIVFGDLEVNLDARSVSVGGREVVLTPTEYAILAYLARNRGKVVTRAKLLQELWGPRSAEKQGCLRVHVLSLRRKIERDASLPETLITEPGVGYILSGRRSRREDSDAYQLRIAPP